MKKFLTYVSMQGTLKEARYKPVDMEGATDDFDSYFPISFLVNNYMKSGEEAELLYMIEKGNEAEENNLITLKNEINKISEKKSISIKWTAIDVEKEENIEAHLLLFERLISHIEDDDRLYVCTTYGTKPVPIVEMMALNFAYRTRKNVIIDKVVYGKILWGCLTEDEKNMGNIYDVTALFSMSMIVNHLSDDAVSDPHKTIRMLLGLED